MNLKETQAEIANFFQREYFNLIRYLRARINDLSQMESEDVISDIMLQMFNNIGIAEQVENLTAYIYRAIYHKAIDHLRKRKRLISLNETITDDDGRILDELLADSRWDTYDEISAWEVQTKLYQALNNLEPKQRAIWIATEIDGHTFRELAELWNQPIGTLLARKHRATMALREALQEFKPKS